MTAENIIGAVCDAPIKLTAWLWEFMNMTMMLWIALLPVALSIATGKSWYLMLILTPYAISSGIYNLCVFENGDDEDDRWVSLSNVTDSSHFVIECMLLILLTR